MNPFKKIYEWLDNYFSSDELERIADLNRIIKALREQLEVQNEKIARLTRDNGELVERIIELEGLIKQKEGVYKHLDKEYKRVWIRYGKRWLLGKKNESLLLMANDFVRPSRTLAYRYRKLKSLKDVWTIRIRYVRDNYQYNGCLDVWQFPEETSQLGAGDCDDSTAFRVAVAKSLGLEKDFGLFMAVGFYINSKGQRFGHAFPVMITSNGEWYILEATSNKYSPVRYPNKHYEIHYLWDENYAWQIGKYKFGGQVLEWFDLNKRRV